MKYLRMLAVSIGVVIVCSLPGPRVRADDWNQETIVTFKAPVEIPGKVLLPGTYDLKLLNCDSDRDVVAHGVPLSFRPLGVPHLRRTLVRVRPRSARVPGEPRACRLGMVPSPMAIIE